MEPSECAVAAVPPSSAAGVGLPKPISLKRRRMPASWHDQKNDRVLATFPALGCRLAKDAGGGSRFQAVASLSDEPSTAWRAVLRATDGCSCLVAGCGAVFASMALLNAHAAAAHMNCCHTCGAAFLRARWAMIHAQEQHPSALFLALVARGEPMFECWVDSCCQRFADAAQRQRHMRVVHRMPTAYFHAPQLTATLQQGAAAPYCGASAAATGSCGAAVVSALAVDGAELGASSSSPAAAGPQRMCSFFNTRGGCWNGASCRFAHVRREQAAPAAAHLPHGAPRSRSRDASAASSSSTAMLTSSAAAAGGMAMDATDPADCAAAPAAGSTTFSGHVGTAAPAGDAIPAAGAAAAEVADSAAAAPRVIARSAAPMFAPRSVSFGMRRGGARFAGVQAASPRPERCAPGPAFRAAEATFGAIKHAFAAEFSAEMSKGALGTVVGLDPAHRRAAALDIDDADL